MVDLLPSNSASYPSVTYNRRPIRVALLDGTPWWDTAQMFGIVSAIVDETFLKTFAPAEMGWHVFETVTESRHVVTTLGALTITSRLPWDRNVMASTWLRRRHAALIAPPGAEPPHVPLTLLANGSMPLKPLYAGQASDEWDALSDAGRSPPVSPEHRAARQAQLLAEAVAQRQHSLAARCLPPPPSPPVNFNAK